MVEIDEEQLTDLCQSIGSIANAITPFGTGDGHDETGGCIRSLTEATMGITAALCRIADAISDLASAVRESHDNDPA